MKYAYCRVSTAHQSIERQITNIQMEHSDVAKFYTEKFTGTKVEGRTELKKLLKVVKPDDTIVFDEVSRMSRNAEEGFALYKELFEKGINLVFLKEPHINTETYKSAMSNQIELLGNEVDSILAGVNEYLLKLAEKQIKLAFIQAEKEVTFIQKRTSEGIREAKKNGKQIGRPIGATVVTKKSIFMKDNIAAMSKDFNGNLTDAKVIEILGIARNTYYKYKRELKAI